MKDAYSCFALLLPTGELDERAFAERRSHRWQEIQPAELEQNIFGQPHRPANTGGHLPNWHFELARIA